MDKEQRIRSALYKLQEQGITVEDLFFYVQHAREMHAPTKELTIPLSLFSQTTLSGLEIVVTYLKENKNLKMGEIATLLHRKQSTISCTYRNARTKDQTLFTPSSSSHDVPVSCLCNRTLSILESIVSFLKEQKLTNHDIAQLLNKDDRTIWTVYHRALIKRGEKRE